MVVHNHRILQHLVHAVRSGDELQIAVLDVAYDFSVHNDHGLHLVRVDEVGDSRRDEAGKHVGLQVELHVRTIEIAHTRLAILRHVQVVRPIVRAVVGVVVAVHVIDVLEPNLHSLGVDQSLSVRNA